MTDSRAKRIALGATFYIALAALLALYWFPVVPRSALGWLLFVLIAPALYLLGEWLGELVDRPWWESSALGKTIKATLMVVTALVLIVVGALLRGV